jgi:hypothetical protein
VALTSVALSAIILRNGAQSTALKALRAGCLMLSGNKTNTTVRTIILHIRVKLL